MLHKLGKALVGEPGIGREVRFVVLPLLIVYGAAVITAVIADTVVAIKQAVVGVAAGSSLAGLFALLVKPSTLVDDRRLERIRHMLAAVAWATALVAGTAQFVHPSSGLYAVVFAAVAFGFVAVFLVPIGQRAHDAGLDRGAEQSRVACDEHGRYEKSCVACQQTLREILQGAPCAPGVLADARIIDLTARVDELERSRSPVLGGVAGRGGAEAKMSNTSHVCQSRWM